MIISTIFHCHHGHQKINVAVLRSGILFLGPSDFTSNDEQNVLRKIHKSTKEINLWLRIHMLKLDVQLCL